MPPLRERLSLRALVEGDGDDKAVMARAIAWMFAVAATLGFAAMAFVPAGYGFDYTANAVILGGAYLVAAAMIAGYDRLPAWVFPLAIAAGTLSAALGVYFNGPRPQDNEMFFLWVVLYAFYFFPLRTALAQLAFVAACYGGALLAIDEGSSTAPAARWLITLGTLTFAGVLVALLKQRVQRLMAGMTRAARTDELTGLLNRRGFGEEYARELERAQRTGRPLSVLVGDLDHFKQLNDRLGHEAGDDGLVRVSRTLEQEMRRIDIAARMGGEEFALIAPESDAQGSHALAERLRAAVAAAFSDGQVPLTISFGVATYPDHGHDARTLLRHADQALYAAKELGRNRSVLHSDAVGRVLAEAAARRGEPSPA